MRGIRLERSVHDAIDQNGLPYFRVAHVVVGR
jgi:hypothetical protein